MPTVAIEPLLHHSIRQPCPRINPINPRKLLPFSLNFSSRAARICGSYSSYGRSKPLFVTACSATSTLPVSSQPTEIVYSETFELPLVQKVEGKICISLDQGKDGDSWILKVGCTLPGKWVLHWGVNYVGDVGREWDQPPNEMRPPGSVAVKDYAIETPLTQSSSSEGCLHEVTIDFNCHSKIAAINFVLKDEETGSWYQHKGMDFVVPLVDYLCDDENVVGMKKEFDSWPGTFGQLSNMLLESDGPLCNVEGIDEASPELALANRILEGFYEEQPIVKEVPVSNSLFVSARKCSETDKNIVFLETDLSGDVVVHWGACRDNPMKWEVPEAPHPPNTEVFKDKALRTKLQTKGDGFGANGLFTLDKEITGFPFVLKVNDQVWLNNRGNDFFIPLSRAQSVGGPSDEIDKKVSSESFSGSVTKDEDPPIENQEILQTTFTDGIIKEIRKLGTDITSDTKWKRKSKEAQETILQEIEKLAAEAYSIYRSSTTTFPVEADLETEELEIPTEICSGTGSGFEILCQGFNWESHKSGRWYMELLEKASELSSLGFTVIWLPPPTESVSPEGYMPKDLYNLNSRYGTIDELKTVIKAFHKVGIKVLGDAVINHRCAHFKNQNGIWNIFGGRLNWDDRAVVADDPHFQGRGNKSSGDNFHAAPNIDHSQDFVRNDLKEWLRWLRKDIGYDGWRLDFVRGFWGGYVKDYIDSSEPYFAVGEYWDSLSYTYGEMDYDQDAHRQRIIDWVNATGGTAGAFDVTTKGILHSVLERCEYWRLSDPKGKPPGVVGWWPSRAVTFIENHDTGSTQGHWRFPGGKEMQGYAYILTHPGTPAVFYDHIFSDYKSEISALISVRNRNKISCRSLVKITKADRDVYAAVIDDKVAMKIGPGHYEPPSGPQQWSVAVEGRDYKVWESK
ncbi:alpha-amylase 3, chloroplastic-like [Chenopodium quinoa]|uniref:alpha-amylase 3, chloroplastic-like n=1 Tax=Chenopodium quinoa TaxID=63459 RepID=UPI000B79821A|nr:alpha-amylase 3, chloroplastic-like [Chenopodium quinoa]